MTQVTSTFFGLLAEYGATEIELSKIAPKYFGFNVSEAKRRAALGTLPLPVHRFAGQKSPWMVAAADLAALIDKARDEAAASWKKLNG